MQITNHCLVHLKLCYMPTISWFKISKNRRVRQLLLLLVRGDFDLQLEITITNDKNIWSDGFQDTGHQPIKDGDFREIESKSGNPFDCPRYIALREGNF